MLLSIDEIESQLNEKFSHFDGEMDDLILKKQLKPELDVAFVEMQLDIKLPDEFVEFIRTYDIDDFSLCNISFGSGKNYLSRLIELNEGNNLNHWWIGSSRPHGIIVIALSDPYTILLNTINEQVYAITDESTMNGWLSVAKSFTLFIRGIGSIFLKKADAFEVESFMGGDDKVFWETVYGQFR
jgi:hypothetical protein